MKVLLQSRETLKFVRSDARLTPDKREAMEFLNGTEAVNFCYAHNLPNMQILGIGQSQSESFTFPVCDSHSE